jgi:cytochrome c oxidase cbb3-type subunit 3
MAFSKSTPARLSLWVAWLVVVGCACGKTAPAPASGPSKPSSKAATPAPVTPPTAASTQSLQITPKYIPPAQRGEELYGKMCAICHGAQGEGYKADQAPAIGGQDFLSSVSDDFLFFAIGVGRKGTTMSAWSKAHGGPLDDGDIAAVIAYLHSLNKTHRAELDHSLMRGDEKRGQALFKQHCERCHGPEGQNVRILNRQWLAYAQPGFLRYAIRKGRPPTPMESFEKELGDRGIEDVVAYLRGLPSWPDPEELKGVAEPPPLPLGPVPLHPKGPPPRGFKPYPGLTPVDVVSAQLKRKARMGLLDARAPSDYMAGHIAGAVSVPFYDTATYLAALPRDAWLVCYCGCPHAESGALARTLTDAGFKHVTVLDEGFGVWMEKGLPTHQGLEP